VLVPAIICLGEKGLRADGSVTVRQACGIRESCDASSYRRMVGGSAGLLQGLVLASSVLWEESGTTKTSIIREVLLRGCRHRGTLVPTGCASLRLILGWRLYYCAWHQIMFIPDVSAKYQLDLDT
jgi:hypothetical protein